MLAVADDVGMGLESLKDFATVEKAAATGSVGSGLGIEDPDGPRVVFFIGREPDIGHSSTVDSFMKVIGAESAWADRFLFASEVFQPLCHPFPSGIHQISVLKGSAREGKGRAVCPQGHREKSVSSFSALRTARPIGNFSSTRAVI